MWFATIFIIYYINMFYLKFLYIAFFSSILFKGWGNYPTRILPKSGDVALKSLDPDPSVRYASQIRPQAPTLTKEVYLIKNAQLRVFQFIISFSTKPNKILVLVLVKETVQPD
jgi:hypothetical protein